MSLFGTSGSLFDGDQLESLSSVGAVQLLRLEEEPETTEGLMAGSYWPSSASLNVMAGRRNIRFLLFATQRTGSKKKVSSCPTVLQGRCKT